MKNINVLKHIRGKFLLIDDFITPDDTLYSFVCCSDIADGKIILNLVYRLT
jgi:hypothetical protein